MNIPNKKSSISFFLIFIFCSPLWAETSYENLVKQLTEEIKNRWKNKTIAILPFENKGQNSAHGNEEIVAEELTTAFVRKKFKIIERASLDKILKEYKLQQSGLISQKKAVKIGKGLGVRGILFGTLRPIQSDRIRVSARLVDTETHEIVSTGSVMMNPSLLQAHKEAKDETQALRPGGLFLNITGGFNFFRQEWEHRFEEIIDAPLFTNVESYHVTESYDAIEYDTSYSFDIKLLFLPDTYVSNGSASGGYILFGLDLTYANYISREQTLVKNTSRVEPGQSVTDFLDTVSGGTLSETLSVSRGDFQANLFLVRPSIYLKINLASYISFLYLGFGIDLGSIRWENKINDFERTAFIAGVTLQMGLRIALSSGLGLVIQSSASPTREATYEDDAQGASQKDSKIKLKGATLSVGLSFFFK